MQLKTIAPFHVFCFDTITTFRNLPDYVRVVARQLYKEAVRHDLEITGPVYWIYKGADGNPDTSFALTIALPVTHAAIEINNSEFKLQTLPTFQCMSCLHNGEWSELGKTYSKIISEILVKEPAMNGENREVYINMDFDNPERNITEVQVGLVP
jgi:effector-binding domain-containing protein